MMVLALSHRSIPPCRRAYFLSLGRKKVAKERATPGSAAGFARSLPLLAWPGGWLNSPRCGSDNASRLLPANLRCSAPLKGTRKPPAADKPLRHSRAGGNPEQCARLLVHAWIPAYAGMTLEIVTAAVHCLKRQKTKHQPLSGDRFSTSRGRRRATQAGRGISAGVV